MQKAHRKSLAFLLAVFMTFVSFPMFPSADLTDDGGFASPIVNVYAATEFELDVECYSNDDGRSHHTSGSSITISAGSRSGYDFVRWDFSRSVDFREKSNGNDYDRYDATTRFYMPDHDLDVEAIWTRDDDYYDNWYYSGSSGGGGGYSYSNGYQSSYNPSSSAPAATPTPAPASSSNSSGSRPASEQPPASDPGTTQPGTTPQGTVQTPAVQQPVISHKMMVLNESLPADANGFPPFILQTLPGTDYVYGMIKVNEVMKFMGAQSTWDSASATAVITGTDSTGMPVTIILSNDSPMITVNGMAYDIADYSGAPQLHGQYKTYNADGALYLPARAITNAFKVALNWNEATATATIVS